MDGVLVIDKPTGPTSHDVVTAVRRILRERRIGHTGTLDPMASGVLPLVIGRATRLASLLTASDKTYEAGVRLGIATRTYDAAERQAAGLPPPPAPDVAVDAVIAALAAFRGEIRQVPPPFSAKKVGGVKAYEAARADAPVPLAPATVTVRHLEVVALEDGLLSLEVTATAGFYVRSLAHDLGASLGCGAHLERLRRTRAAGFTLEAAMTIETLQADPSSAAARLVPLAALATDLPAVRVSDTGRVRASHGNFLLPRDFAVESGARPAAPGEKVRLLHSDAGLVGIAVAGPDGVLRPSIVLV